MAQTYGRRTVGPGDEIVITALEHHSNIVPWQMLCEETGATLRVVPIDDAGEVDVDEYERLLGERTRLVAVAHVSNALGTIVPVKRMIEAAHRRGIAVLVDGAQAAPHLRVDVQDLDCDFYTFSGHKTYGPTGIGVLYGKTALPRGDAALPGRGRHDQVGQLREDRLQRPAVQVRGGHAAHRGRHRPRRRARVPGRASGSTGSRPTSTSCSSMARSGSRRIPGLRLIGTAREKAAVLSFVVDGVHAHDVGTHPRPRGHRGARRGTTARCRS